MQKFLIIIDGPMGSGKTTIGRLLSEKLSRTAVLSTDMIKFFISDFERGDRDNIISVAVLVAMVREYIRQGLNILLPQGFWKKEYLEPYIKLAEENKLKLLMYQLEGPKDFLLERIRNRPKPELAKTPVSQERIERNLKTWEENRYQFGRVFDITKYNSEEIANFILEEVKTL